MDSKKLITEIKRKHKLSTNRQVAVYLGMTEVQLNNWKSSTKPLTPRQIANAIDKASNVAIRKAHLATIRPIIEFFPISSSPSRGGVSQELFSAGKKQNPMLDGLKDELSKSYGIYIFYDTRGRAIYAGKAKEQTLWNEMKSAFNRNRKTQSVYRVKHPQNPKTFVPANESFAQPIQTAVQLHDISAYFSAYEIDKAMINDLEALVVRAFANDLLNARMERFAGVRKAANSRPRKRRK